MRQLRRGTILCFHSITTPARAAAGTAHVAADAFRWFVITARQLGEIVPLSELLRRHGQGRSTAGLVALTFDDAYAALLTDVQEFLTRHAVPIAVFPVTDAAATGAKFWWDRIDDLFTRVSPERWRQFETTCGLPDAYRRGQPRDQGPLRPLRQWLLAAFSGRWPDHLEPALQALEVETGYQSLHRSMTFDELSALGSKCAMEVGVHTVSHPVLPLLSDDELHQEIRVAHDILRDRFARILPVLAIPFGLYDQRTLRIARATGMSESLTLAGAMNQANDDGSVPRLCMTSGDTRVKLGLRLLGVPDVMRRWSRRPPATYPALPSPTT